MRKFFRKAILSVCIFSMGLVNVSCDSDTITELITILITNLVGQQGTTYTFSGTGTAQELIMQSDGQYQYGNATPSKFNGTFSVTVNNTLANMTVPGMTVNGATMSAINFYNLSMTATSNNTTLDVGESTSAEGSLTVDGAEYPIYQVYIEYENEQLKTTVTSQKLIIPIMSIYFGPNGEYAMNLTYTGNAVTEQ